MQNHPFADLFPMMSDVEFADLCADIQANGLREDIITYYNKILDGRNRYKACLKVHVKPRFKDYVGSDARAFVISKNLHRRHLNESQRAMLASKLRKTDSPIGELTQAEAAKTLNVSKRSVERSDIILAKGSPELIASVESGKVSVSKAVKAIREPKAVDLEAVSAATLAHIIKISDKLLRADWIQLGLLCADKVE